MSILSLFSKAKNASKFTKLGSRIKKTETSIAKLEKNMARLTKTTAKKPGLIRRMLKLGGIGALGYGALSGGNSGGNSGVPKNAPKNASGLPGKGRNLKSFSGLSAADKDFINNLLGRKKTKESPKFINYVFRHSENTKKGVEKSVSANIRDELAEMNQRMYAELYNMRYPAQFRHISENITSEYFSKIVDLQKKLDYKAQEEQFSSENLLKLVEIQTGIRDILARMHEDMIDEQDTTIKKEPKIIINQISNNYGDSRAALALGMDNRSLLDGICSTLAVLAGAMLPIMANVAGSMKEFIDDFIEENSDNGIVETISSAFNALGTALTFKEASDYSKSKKESPKSETKKQSESKKQPESKNQSESKKGASKSELPKSELPKTETAAKTPTSVSAEQNKKAAESLGERLKRNLGKHFGKYKTLFKFGSKLFTPAMVVTEYLDAAVRIWDIMHRSVDDAIDKCDELLEKIPTEGKDNIIMRRKLEFARVILKEEHSPNIAETVFAGFAEYGNGLINTAMGLGAGFQLVKNGITGSNDFSDYETIINMIAERAEEHSEAMNALYKFPLPDDFDPNDPLTILTKEQHEQIEKDIGSNFSKNTQFFADMFDYRAWDNKQSSQDFFKDTQSLVSASYRTWETSEYLLNKQADYYYVRYEYLAEYYYYLSCILKGISVKSAKNMFFRRKTDEAIHLAMHSSEFFEELWDKINDEGTLDSDKDSNLLMLCLTVYFTDIAKNSNSLLKSAVKVMIRKHKLNPSEYNLENAWYMYESSRGKGSFYADMKGFYDDVKSMMSLPIHLRYTYGYNNPKIADIFLDYYEVLKICDAGFESYLRKENVIDLKMPEETKAPVQADSGNAGTVEGTSAGKTSSSPIKEPDPEEKDQNSPGTPKPEKEEIVPKKERKTPEFTPKLPKTGEDVKINDIITTKMDNQFKPGDISAEIITDKRHRDFVSSLNGKSESGNNPGAVNAFDTHGTLSLGLHQINAARSKGSSFENFLYFCKNSDTKIGQTVWNSLNNYTDYKNIYATAESRNNVIAIWKKLAKDHPTEFAEIQESYIFKHYYYDAFKKLNVNAQKAVNANPVLQQVFLSDNVHKGIGTGKNGGTGDFNKYYNEDPATYINNIYYARMNTAKRQLNQYKNILSNPNLSKGEIRDAENHVKLFSGQLRNLEGERLRALNNLKENGFEVSPDKFVPIETLESNIEEKKEESSNVIVENEPQKTINPEDRVSSEDLFIIPLSDAEFVWI